MLKIRLQRVGRKHEPGFRLVLTDSKNSTKSGRFAEVLGSYDPRKMTESFKIERIKHWLSRGIELTPSVNNLLIKHGILRGKKIHVSKIPNLQITTDEQPPAPAVEETQPSHEASVGEDATINTDEPVQ
jgi:small subunit ribosomal protein S16